MSFRIEPLRAGHDRSRFDCGEEALNEYLRRFARQNEESGVSRAYVAVPEGDARVVGFYTLSSGSVEFAEVPQELRERLPRYPIPVARIGRLGVCRSVRGQGLGGALLVDALRRVIALSEEIGIVAVEVRAKREAARRFYDHYGFEAMLDEPMHLCLPLTTAREGVGEG